MHVLVVSVVVSPQFESQFAAAKEQAEGKRHEKARKRKLLADAGLLRAGRTPRNDTRYNEIFTLHGAFMVFLFVIPAIPGSLGNMVMPLMVGAKDVALPRLNSRFASRLDINASFARFHFTDSKQVEMQAENYLQSPCASLE